MLRARIASTDAIDPLPHIGSHHLMLDLQRDLAAGTTIPVRLHFARAGLIATTARVELGR